MSELNPAGRLRKTDAGIAAIKDRDRAVAPRARTLLILVDGTKTVAQLAAMNTDVAQGMALLGQLLAGGYVSISEGAAAASPSPVATTPSPTPVASSSATAQPAPKPARDLKTSIRAATRYLETMMGPGADSFNLQLERCKSVEEFEAKVQEITLLLARARSVKKAEEFSAAALGR